MPALSKEQHLIIPTTFAEFISELEKAKITLGPNILYRGQHSTHWEINSKLQREVHKQFKDTPPTHSINQFFLEQFEAYFRSLRPTEELRKNLNGQGCPYYEMARHHRQNYSKAKIHRIEDCTVGSPLIDFSLNEFVALFFANFDINYETFDLNKRISDGALYIINYNYLSLYRNIPHLMSFELYDRDYLRFRKAVIISPSHHINDSNDQKPKNQEARYLVQLDARHSIEDTLLNIEKEIGKQLYFKIQLSKEFFEECRKFLFDKHYTRGSILIYHNKVAGTFGNKPIEIDISPQTVCVQSQYSSFPIII